MSAMSGWFTTVLAVLGLVLVLHHLGVDVSTTLVSGVRGIEHLLGLPLASL